MEEWRFIAYKRVQDLFGEVTVNKKCEYYIGLWEVEQLKAPAYCVILGNNSKEPLEGVQGT